MRYVRSNTKRAAGFTLLELMLVLALLVVVAALALPALFGPLQDYKLLKAGDQVRAVWANTRITAMRTGQTMMFRYQPESGLYEIQPWQAEGFELEASVSRAAGSAGMVTGDAVSSLSEPVVESLPEGSRFAELKSADSSRDMYSQMQMQQMDSQVTVSPPILFYPDGTTSTVQLTLTNDRGWFVVLQLRGLTGVTRVSDLLTIDEVPQL